VTLVWVALGSLLFLSLVADVFITVFHPHGHGGFWTRRQNRLLWRAARRFGVRVDGTTREWLLALAAPTMVVATLIGWLLALVLAFSLVHYPFLDRMLVDPGELRTPWVEAFYYSGNAISTLGLGDVVADAPGLRFLAPVQAFLGFALISAAISYVLATYRELLRMQTLAARIAGYFAVNDVLAPEFAGGGRFQAMAQWGEAVSGELLHLLQAHSQYPILHYFRAGDPSHALAVQLRHLMKVRAAVRDPSEQPVGDLGAHPSWRALDHSLERYLQEVSGYFLPPGSDTPPPDRTDDPVADAHRRLLGYMLYDRHVP
jgi:hypothetical protein